MSTSLYRDSQMEQELHSKIDAAANERHGGAVPVTVRRKAWVSKRASTMEHTVCFKKPVFRCSRVMIFSQSHWST